jgi:hypothetical protein
MKRILCILLGILLIFSLLATFTGCTGVQPASPLENAGDIASDMGNEVLEMQEMMGGLMPFQTESSSESSVSESISE